MCPPADVSSGPVGGRASRVALTPRAAGLTPHATALTPHAAACCRCPSSQVRGWGLILGIELTESCGFVAADVVARLMEGGMLTVPAGQRVVRFVPPLVVSEAEIDEALTKCADVLNALKQPA